MTKSDPLRISPPSHLKHLHSFEPTAFRQELKVMGIRYPARETKRLSALFRNELLDMPKVKHIRQDEKDPSKRILLFRPAFQSVESFDIELQQHLKDDLEIVQYSILLDEHYWTADELVSAILPDHLSCGCSFETVGHIAHLNLRDELLPFKSIIGEIVLFKNQPKIKTVVIKTDIIETKFRTFPMEVIAGEENFLSEVSENGCRFRFNFASVYWNSRLQFEHVRLLKLFQPGQVVCDVFAGVGPFALPAARQNSLVLANDLNPESFKYLQSNQMLNKIPDTRIRCFNLDGRDFIRTMFTKVDTYFEGKVINHVVMNLPALAIEFLDAFLNADVPLRLQSLYEQTKMPLMVHCHCFSKHEENPEADVVNRIESVLKVKLSSPSVHHVRTVAPKKDMFCVSFEYPRYLLTGSREPVSKRQTNDEELVVEKKTKMDNTEAVSR